MAGANKSSVIDSMVRTLGKLLSPLTSGQPTNSYRLDVILIGWVLLFLSVCLDTTTIQPPCVEDNQEKSKEQSMSCAYVRDAINVQFQPTLLMYLYIVNFGRSVISLGIYTRRIGHAEKVRQREPIIGLA